MTDVLARGLDVLDTAVINYDCVFRTETYVHRVGRAARAGTPGEAYTLGTFGDLGRFLAMRQGSIQGGQLVLPKLKPSRYFLAQHRPQFLEQVEQLRVKSYRLSTREKSDLKREQSALRLPLESNLEQAKKLLE